MQRIIRPLCLGTIPTAAFADGNQMSAICHNNRPECQILYKSEHDESRQDKAQGQAPTLDV